jgi:hypothetical protein
MHIKPEKKYYIRAFITDMKKESIIGLIGHGPFRIHNGREFHNGREWGFWITLDFKQACDFGSRENALDKINKIINELQHICINLNMDVNNTDDCIHFILSVVEVDIDDVSMKRLDYFAGIIYDNQTTITNKQSLTKE